jgi:polyisoprenoid-binding protein YceI
MKTFFIVIAIIAVVIIVWRVSHKDTNSLTIADTATEKSIVGDSVSIPQDVANIIEPPQADLLDVPEDATIALTSGSIKFKGFGPGKEHIGSFGSVTSSVIQSGQSLNGKIEVAIASMTSDSDKLTTHLKSPDFFDVERFPKATFIITENTSTRVTGALTIHGVTRTVNAPLQKTTTGYTSSLALNLKDYGISQIFANEQIELTISLNK